MSTAELVRDARSSAGLTQAQLALRAGTSQAAIARYERGVELPTLPTLERLLRACGRRLELSSTPLAPGAPSPVQSVRAQLGPRAAKLRRRRAQVLAALRARGGRRPRIYGSVARGDERPGSDVDLLVDLPQGCSPLELAGLQSELAEILGERVDLATPETLKPEAREQAFREAVPL